ncbi:MAG: hypothetical protein LC624_04320 [Halobacteriales archaeon]|nr:hypothetical protein [Halobacteriales archaeon]
MPTQPRRRAGLLVASLAALFLVLPCPMSGAQAPGLPGLPGTTPVASELLTRVSVTIEPGAQDVARLSQVQYKVTVQDLSSDTQGGQSLHHVIHLDLEVNRTASPGWVAFLSGGSVFQTKAGETVETSVTVQAPPTIKSVYFRGTVLARLESQEVTTVATDEAEVVAHVTMFSLPAVDIRAAPAEVGPDETVTFPVTITNAGLYPDQFTIEASGPEGWFVAAQPRATLFPDETRDIPIVLITPATRVFVPQETGIITVRVSSVNDPGAVYERAAVVVLQGTYIPGYWGPLLALGLVAGASLAARSVESTRRRNRELGKPLPPRLTAAQAIALQSLKKRDPERYRAIARGQRRVFLAQQRAFSSVRTKRMKLETTLLHKERAKERDEDFEKKVRERLAQQKAQELARTQAKLDRERKERARAEAAAQQRAEQATERERKRQERMAAPMQRKLERERKLRERQLQAELRKKRRLMDIEQRKKRVELERKRRILERKQREAERRAARAGPKKPKKGREGA